MFSMNAFKNIKASNCLNNLSKKYFSHGPYNPMNYKKKLVSDKKYT